RQAEQADYQRHSVHVASSWAGSLAQSAEGEKRAMSCLHVTVAVRDHQGWPALPDAELPGEVVGCHAVHADAEAVDAVQVVGRADGDPVVARVVAAARAVDRAFGLRAFPDYVRERLGCS